MLLLFAAAPAPSIGGAAAADPVRGGARFSSDGPPPPAKRPVVSQLLVAPRDVVAGDALPLLRFRVRQRGIEQVQARIVVLRLPRNAPVARMTLGWVKTGRAITARWPSGVTLREGRYLVSLHAKDSRGHNLHRNARVPGRARIVVRERKAAAVVAPAPPAALPAPAISASGRGVFPVAGPFSLGGADALFGASRTGHVHEGQDITAATGTPVVAPYGGTVSSTSYQARGGGEYIVLDAADGRDYFFAHCLRRSTTVPQGAVVAAGAPLCRVGSTGSASGPHLHFEIWNVGWRVAGGHPIDPLPELRAWAPG